MPRRIYGMILGVKIGKFELCAQLRAINLTGGNPV